MTLADKLKWARAFILQARLDIDLANSLYCIINSVEANKYLGTRPELYIPAIYAYCQQATEKSIKAWLWRSKGAIPRKHNPLSNLIHSAEMKKKNRPDHLEIIARNKEFINSVLDMAPGSGLSRPSLKQLLTKPNTEYPFIATDRGIRLPCQEISRDDVIAALKITRPLVKSIEKSLEVVCLTPKCMDNL